MAEREGFEPPVGCPTTVFKTAALSHSAISPERQIYTCYDADSMFEVTRNRPAAALFAALGASFALGADAADLQFFGDVFISERSLRETDSSPEVPAIFLGVADLLGTAAHSVINLEGVITDAFVPPERKRHLLKMPFETARLLRSAGITAATLANNGRQERESRRVVMELQA